MKLIVDAITINTIRSTLTTPLHNKKKIIKEEEEEEELHFSLQWTSGQ